MSATITQPRRQRLQRSELAVPATSERFFSKACASDADVVFLDLEDAVADRFKDDARHKAIEALNTLDWRNKSVAVRINGLDTPWALRDLIDVVSECPRLDMILLPKAGTAFDVQFVAQVLSAIEREKGRDKRVGIEVLIETSLGVAHAEEIAASSDRLEAMIFGIGDYTVDMRTDDFVFGTPSARYAVLTAADAQGVRQRHWNDQWHFALARIANACRAYGVRAIDGPFTDFGDAEGYRASATRSAALGFEGKWAIHPSQVEIANEVYAPSAEQLAWSTQVLGTLESAAAQGNGAVGDKGVLIDLAHAKLARSLQQRQAVIERHMAARVNRQ
ncbi:citrate lyase beta subunit [Variovorax sp. CF313]|uniref:HpcH/HpaI aldolase/citrate lyase family protein n=1 Tax=Variovorax sp. CF313 TaxID=1144315 RepID=UPI000270EC24|nr:CoA ester lyase [Variovorax sp. CF313]EJL72303.1 citrate lyase beta subunit [Variovorax sp. CF313]